MPLRGLQKTTFEDCRVILQFGSVDPDCPLCAGQRVISTVVSVAEQTFYGAG